MLIPRSERMNEIVITGILWERAPLRSIRDASHQRSRDSINPLQQERTVYCVSSFIDLHHRHRFAYSRVPLAKGTSNGRLVESNKSVHSGWRWRKPRCSPCVTNCGVIRQTFHSAFWHFSSRKIIEANAFTTPDAKWFIVSLLSLQTRSRLAILEAAQDVKSTPTRNTNTAKHIWRCIRLK